MTTFQQSNPQKSACPVWRCGDGRRIHVTDLTSGHLENIQRKLATYANDALRAIRDLGRYEGRSYGIANPPLRKSFKDLKELQQNIRDWILVIDREIDRRARCLPHTEQLSHVTYPQHTIRALRKQVADLEWRLREALPDPPGSPPRFLGHTHSLHTPADALKHQVEQLESRNLYLQTRLDSVRRESNCWRGQFHGLEAGLKLVRDARDRWQKDYHTVEVKLAEVQRERDCWRVEEHMRESQIATLKVKLADVIAERDRWRERYYRRCGAGAPPIEPKPDQQGRVMGGPS